MKDDVGQPLGMEPRPAVAGEGKRIREVERAGLHNPATAGKVPPEIRALHGGETKGPDGQNDGGPPAERDRSRLRRGRRWQAAFAPGFRPARRLGLLFGGRVPHFRPPSTPSGPPGKGSVHHRMPPSPGGNRLHGCRVYPLGPDLRRQVPSGWKDEGCWTWRGGASASPVAALARASFSQALA